MADEIDRTTGIFGDQIKDFSISPREFNTIGQEVKPKGWQMLGFDFANDKMKWFYLIGNKILR